jgi:hypothetical protein
MSVSITEIRLLTILSDIHSALGESPGRYTNEQGAVYDTIVLLAKQNLCVTITCLNLPERERASRVVLRMPICPEFNREEVALIASAANGSA